MKVSLAGGLLQQPETPAGSGSWSWSHFELCSAQQLPCSVTTLMGKVVLANLAMMAFISSQSTFALKVCTLFFL